MIKRILNKSKRTLIHSKYSIGLSQNIINPGTIGNHIIMYHGVDLIENKKYNQRFIGFDNLRKQLIYLKKNTNILPLTDFFEEKFNKKQINVSLTFDDGFLNNYKYVLPLLEELKIPATIYVTGLNMTNYSVLWPDFLDLNTPLVSQDLIIGNEVFKKINNRFVSIETQMSLAQTIKNNGVFEYKKLVFEAFDKILGIDSNVNDALEDYWKLMTDEQIKEVDKSKYIDIESHSFLHNNLGNISLENAIEELYVSKKYLENLLQREVKHLAYPDGSYTRELIDEAFKLGYKYQVAAEGYLFPELDQKDPRILDRTGFYPANSWANQLDLMFNN